MRLTRDYKGWDPDDPLDPDPAALLASLEEMAPGGGLTEVTARIDEYGVVFVGAPVGNAELFLQVGDGWDRFIWTARSGRGFEWDWDEVHGPKQLRALLDGRGVERLTFLGSRRLAVELIVDGETLASYGGLLRRLVPRLKPSLTTREEPAL